MPTLPDPRLSTLRRRRPHLGLDGIRPVLQALGSPQDQAPSVLVAGTNGKGSTAALLESMLRTAGYRTGLYHSPSLGEDRDQIRIAGRGLSRAAFGAHLRRVIDMGEEAAPGRLTYFEALTATAFFAFAEEGVEIAVVEVGMGGAGDCTNVINDPRVSILVSVALDHQEYLGSDLAAITQEKAGIFRPGRAAILGWLEPEAERVALSHAQAIGALPRLAPNSSPMVEAARPPEATQGEDSSPAASVAPSGAFLVSGGRKYPFELRLPGAHQLRNAALALCAVEELQKLGFDRPGPRSMIEGLEGCRWPGRLEWLSGGRRPVLLDAAHNPSAVRTLVEFLEASPLRPDLLFGAFRDKDHAAMLALLLPRVGRVWLLATEHPRAAPAASLALGLPDTPEGPASTVLGLQELDHALQPSEAPLLVTGSIDLVSHVRAYLLEHGWKL